MAKIIDTKTLRPAAGSGRKLYIETYGCQMNVGDSEIVAAIMQGEGYVLTKAVEQADVILINTCSIRDNAEQRVWGRLAELQSHKKRRPGVSLGVIGCMAERLREELFERRAVDVVAGPDAYRDLPRLLRAAAEGGRGINVELSREETYAEISPVRLDTAGVGAFIAIMRGCNNFCSYCVVPYTRGRERSRDPQTILREARELFEAGYREVTLLGQNVNSYKYGETGAYGEAGGADGCGGVGFAQLLAAVAAISPLLRVRFATSHPKDLSDAVLEVIAATPNICRAIHLPAQSGSSGVLARMNRRYTREWYLGRSAAIRSRMPDCAISTDLIAGFCGESEDDHRQTLSLMREAGFDFAYMFKYSERPGTKAAEGMADDVPEEEKTRRLNEIIALQNELSLASNRRDVGKRFEVLVEGESKRSADRLFGRTSQNKVVVFPRGAHKPGDYITIEITGCTSATLTGRVV